MEKINNMKLQNTAKILQEILTIVMAIAFTTSIIMFLTKGTNFPLGFEQVTVESIFGFICVITAIIRFFHGNINYLSSVYNVPDYIAVHRKYNLRLSIDFVFLFIQAFIFCCLALYQFMQFDFYILFVVLFIVDALWFFIIISFSRGLWHVEYRTPEESALMNWMVTNFITAMLLLFIIYSGGIEDLSRKVPLLFAIIMGNTIFDYALNWQSLYFPSLKKKGRNPIFVAARFTTALNSDGTFDNELKKKIIAVYEVITQMGFDVTSSHQVEKFGKEKSEPDSFVERDIKNICESDVFILLLDNLISAGAFTELGWASLLNKPIIILVPANYDIENTCPHIQGLHRITNCEIIKYTDHVKLKDSLSIVLGRVSK